VADRRALRRRAALRAALRTGDLPSVARAWERMRVGGAVLTREEAAAAHAARATLGRAIRDARWRRAHPQARPSLTLADQTLALPESALVRFRGTISTAAALLLVFGLLLVLFPPQAPAGDVPAAPPSQAQPEPTRAPTGGRGRTSATLAPVALAPTPALEPTPTPEPTPAPTVAPATPAPASAPVARTAAPAGSPPTSAAPGGVPGGTGSGGASAAPAPKANVLPLDPPPLPAGTERFLFRIVDSRTGVPLANVCVVLGTRECGPNDYHTNTLGYYWLDLTGRVATNWSFGFRLDGYVTVNVNKTYRTGQGTVVTIIDLRAR